MLVQIMASLGNTLAFGSSLHVSYDKQPARYHTSYIFRQYTMPSHEDKPLHQVVPENL